MKIIPYKFFLFYVMLLWPFALLFMQFRLFWIGTFPFTISTLIYLVFIIFFLLFSKTNPKHVIIALVILLYAIIVGFWNDNMIEYIKSLLLLINLILMMLFVIDMPIPSSELIKKSVTIFLRISWVIAILVILQAITLNFLGTAILTNPFGPFAPMGPGGQIYVPDPNAAIKRPSGVFSEPSIVGWFMTFATAVALCSPILTGRKETRAAIVFAIAVLSSFSLSGFVDIVAVFMVYLFITNKKKINNKSMMILQIGAIISVVLVFLAIFIFIVSHRMGDFLVEGTSTYFRTIAPLLLLSDSLPAFPFGHPLGQTSYIESKDYMVNWAEGDDTHIENSFLFISFYLGFIGVGITVLVIFYLIRSILQKKIESLMMLSVVLTLMETGSLWAHHVIMYMGYAIILIRFIQIARKQKQTST